MNQKTDGLTVNWLNSRQIGGRWVGDGCCQVHWNYSHCDKLKRKFIGQLKNLITLLWHPLQSNNVLFLPTSQWWWWWWCREMFARYSIGHWKAIRASSRPSPSSALNRWLGSGKDTRCGCQVEGCRGGWWCCCWSRGWWLAGKPVISWKVDEGGWIWIFKNENVNLRDVEDTQVE